MIIDPLIHSIHSFDDSYPHSTVPAHGANLPAYPEGNVASHPPRQQLATTVYMHTNCRRAIGRFFSRERKGVSTSDFHTAQVSVSTVPS